MSGFRRTVMLLIGSSTQSLYSYDFKFEYGDWTVPVWDFYTILKPNTGKYQLTAFNILTKEINIPTGQTDFGNLTVSLVELNKDFTGHYESSLPSDMTIGNGNAIIGNTSDSDLYKTSSFTEGSVTTPLITHPSSGYVFNRIGGSYTTSSGKYVALMVQPPINSYIKSGFVFSFNISITLTKVS